MSHITLFYLCSISTVLFSQVSSLQEDYYWREYTGSIPGDAVVGGKDINGHDIHMGQAYIRNHGLIVVQIYPGVKEVHAAIAGIKTVSTYVKILCGPQENFYWLPANATDLHLSLLDKHAVIGGHNDGYGQINIGRIKHEGETKIGKINSWAVGGAYFYFNNKGKEGVNVKSYEILIYRNADIDVRIKSN
ncbi:DUF3421 domain containing protein [Asbolus verrucosus]|uniref:DUF3421 domain containing protein n=1 Tax=Asbolus verrucosus TaxID=1661398 RepID=A0A482VSG9_ASBVE|nr:DUF3421 domain containing protein [Asbolus verrucosus]